MISHCSFGFSAFSAFSALSALPVLTYVQYAALRFSKCAENPVPQRDHEQALTSLDPGSLLFCVR